MKSAETLLRNNRTPVNRTGQSGIEPQKTWWGEAGECCRDLRE